MTILTAGEKLHFPSIDSTAGFGYNERTRPDLNLKKRGMLTMDESKLAERLLTLRTERNLTQEETAEKISVSNKTYSKWETGTTSPDLETLVKLARFFGVTADNLLGLSVTSVPTFEDAVRAETERNSDNPAEAYFRMYETLIRSSDSALEDGGGHRTWLPDQSDERLRYPRCVVSNQNAYQLSVNSPAVNFVFALFRSGEDFEWLNDAEKREKIASLFAFLSDPDALSLCRAVHDSRFPASFTARKIAETTGVDEDKAARILGQMKSFRFCESETAHLADGDMEVYRSLGAGRILGLIALAYEHCCGKTAHWIGMNTGMCRLIGGDEE